MGTGLLRATTPCPFGRPAWEGPQLLLALAEWTRAGRTKGWPATSDPGLLALWPSLESAQELDQRSGDGQLLLEG